MLKTLHRLKEVIKFKQFLYIPKIWITQYQLCLSKKLLRPLKF